MHAIAAPGAGVPMIAPPLEILSTHAMGAADRYAIEAGRSGGALMDAAGAGIASAIQQRWAPRATAVLCGPGNNGGDGWEAAHLLARAGWPVRVFSLVERGALNGDAARAAQKWADDVAPLERCDPAQFALVIDALFGAGLTRALDGEAARLAEQTQRGSRVVVSADVPSGVDGDLARPLGPAFTADLTVTFHRFKPAHLLQPAAKLCGEVTLVDIGIPAGWEQAAAPQAHLNDPTLWPSTGRALDVEAHKHSRGRLCVRAGPKGATGAARLSARAALIGGAGFVTLLCRDNALVEAAKEDAALVTRAFAAEDGFGEILAAHRADAWVIGPGAGLTDSLRRAVVSALERGGPGVLDADALSVFASGVQTLFEALHDQVVLTPHGGEFARLFPDLAAESNLSKIEKTRRAAMRAGCIVLHKGPDTVIADPQGRVRVNAHASAALATAGTGDVLAGLIGAFLAQGVNAFDAASAGAWIHGEAGRRSGAGATVDTVLAKSPGALAHLVDLHTRQAALRRVTAADG